MGGEPLRPGRLVEELAETGLLLLGRRGEPEAAGDTRATGA